MVSQQGRLRGINASHEGVAGKNAGDSVHRAQRIFSGRGGVAAEDARELLLHLHHADIPFCQIVVECETEVVHESQDFLSVLIESFE